MEREGRRRQYGEGRVEGDNMEREGRRQYGEGRVEGDNMD